MGPKECHELHQRRPLPALFWFAGILSALMFLFLAFYLHHFFSPGQRRGVTNLSENWIWWSSQDPTPHLLPYLEHVEDIPPGQTLYLSRTLAEETEGRSLLVKCYYQFLALYIGEELRLDLSAQATGEKPGCSLSLVPLTAQDQGRQLVLELSSPYLSYTGSPKPLYLGEPQALYAWVFSCGFPYLLSLFTCAAVGSFFLFAGLHSVLVRIPHWDWFFFGLFSVLLGCFSICRQDVIYLLFPPHLAASLAIGLHLVYLIPLMAYLCCCFPRYRRLLVVLLALLIGWAAVAVGLHLSGTADLAATLPVTNRVLVLLFLPVGGLMVLELVRGNRMVRFVSPFIGLIALTSLYTILEYNQNQSRSVPFYLASAFLLMSIIWVYYLRQFLAGRARERDLLQHYQLYSSLAMKNYRLQLAHNQRLRVVRHEFKHHITALAALCKTGSLERMSQYLSQMAKQSDPVDSVFSQNHLVQCLLADSFVQAREAGIQVQYLAQVPPELPLPDQDLCSLLSNLLDNALEACLSLPAGQPRWIRMQLSLKGQLLFLCCVNPALPPVFGPDGFPLSSKQGEGHGYGLHIADAIVRRYHNQLDLCYRDGCFTVSTALSLPAHQRTENPDSEERSDHPCTKSPSATMNQSF